MHPQPSPAVARAIPPDTPHSVIHSLPEWQDNVDYSEGKKELFDSFETTYPRFVIHPLVKQVCEILFSACASVHFSYVKLVHVVLEECDAGQERRCLLYPSRNMAEACRSFLHRQFPLSASAMEVRCVTEIASAPDMHQIFAVIFSEEQEKMAMTFWTFAGGGISSRLAELCLLRRSGNLQPTLGLPCQADHLFSDYYRKHAPLSSVVSAKEAIRMRFSGVTKDGGNIRGIPGVSPNDVYLFPTGMSAIWNSHQLLSSTIASKTGLGALKTAHVKSVRSILDTNADVDRSCQHSLR